MELVPAADAVRFLSQSAPVPWVRRMLLWMICSDEIDPFFLAGRSIATAPAMAYLHVMGRGEEPSEAERARFIERNFEPELAAKLLIAKPMDDVEQIVCSWSKEDEELHPVSAGPFLYAEHIDWDLGSVDSEVYVSGGDRPFLFSESDELLAGIPRPCIYNIELRGLGFDREKIEMLQPQVSLASAQAFGTTEAKRKGRPRSWDWDGATLHLLAAANSPDGLPTGHGAQARIEGIISDWFVASSGNSPAESQVRDHAVKIMAAINKPKNR